MKVNNWLTAKPCHWRSSSTHCNILSYRPTVSARLYTHTIDLYKFFFKVYTFDQRWWRVDGIFRKRKDQRYTWGRMRGEGVSSATTDLDQKYLLQNQSQRHQYFITEEPAGRRTPPPATIPFLSFPRLQASCWTIVFSHILKFTLILSTEPPTHTAALLPKSLEPHHWQNPEIMLLFK